MGLQYYDDVAVCLRGIILAALAPAYAARNSRQVRPLLAPDPLQSIVWPCSWCSIGRGSGRHPPLFLTPPPPFPLILPLLWPDVVKSLAASLHLALTAFMWSCIAFIHLAACSLTCFFSSVTVAMLTVYLVSMVFNGVSDGTAQSTQVHHVFCCSLFVPSTSSHLCGTSVFMLAQPALTQHTSSMLVPLC